MLAKIGKGLLLLIGVLMILSVTVFDPADLTERAKRLFNLRTGPRADRDIRGLATTTGREVVEEDENTRLRHLIEGLQVADTRGIVEHLSTLPHSRVVGYQGNQMAAEYVEEAFREVGLQGIRSQSYHVTVPVDEGGKMTFADPSLGQEPVELFALWPNEVRTSFLPKGFTGTLIDGGRGKFEDFNGKRFTRTVDGEEVPEAVVLMDFDCGQDWLNAAMLGAKAVVFFDNAASGEADVVTRGEAERKFVGVPADVPRFWVRREDGLRLRRLLREHEDGLKVAMRSRMVWRRVPTRNILGVIPGTLPPVRPSDKHDYKRRRIIVVTAFYDAMSVVPRAAPGAENACGLAALLQTARVLKQFPPRHTVVFLATGSHFHCLWGVQHFLTEVLPTEDELERRELPEGRIDFDVLVALDLTSRHHQVATTCFDTFFSKHWESNVYRKNLLAPYAKKFTQYAARVFRKSTSEATCPHINAITPPKKTWKNFVPRPVAFDSEPVIARGKDAVTLFTPHDIRNFIDTPADTVEKMDIEKLHTQVKTVAAVLAKAGRDVQFFADSKLHLQNRINYSRGNVTWFDRAQNPNIPKAPIGRAVVTFRHPAADTTCAGVRTLYTAYSQPDDPHRGDHRQGVRVSNVTLNSRRIRISIWSDQVGELEGAEAVLQAHRWRFRRPLERVDDGRARIEVAERFILDEEGPVRLPTEAGEQRGRWEPVPVGMGERQGVFIPPSGDDPDFPTPSGWAHVRVGNARFRGPLIVPPVRYEADVDTNPPGWVSRFFQRAVGGREIENVQAELPPEAPDIDPFLRKVVSVRLEGAEGTYEERDIDVAFGKFEGQFIFPFVYFWQWGEKQLLAYKLDDEDGSILYAQDEGSQGKETYPNDVKYGGGAQCVLFRCKPLTIIEIVDSRYLTVLDQVGVLGPENSVPQQWGARFIPGQSREEGTTTCAAVVFGKYDPDRDKYHHLKIHMGTGLYGVKLLLTNAQLRRDGRAIAVPPADPSVNLDVGRDEARGEGYRIDGGVLLNPTYRVAWDMWVLNEYRLRELEQYGIRSNLLFDLHNRARSALRKAHAAVHAEEPDYEKFIAESRRAWGFEAKAYPDVAAQADDTVKGVVFYFVLLIPFAFFMERLLIGSPGIKRRILWFSVIFLVVFVVLRLVHPAFRISSSPYIILLAFIILSMGVIVLFIVVSKFNQEIRKMKQAAEGVQQADVGRLSASYAAVMLGISNLRKRKIRTTLTAVTLTLLTFTVLSFTSINKTITLFRLSRSNHPGYEGALVRDRNWRGMQDVVLDYLRSEFAEEANIAPRAWLVSKKKGERAFFEFTAPGGRSNVNGIVGLTPEEALINPVRTEDGETRGGPQRFLLPGSRWFRPDDRYVCILPDDVAARVGIEPQDVSREAEPDNPTIRLFGRQFRVVGLLDSKGLNQYKDIDDEKLTPVDTLQEAAKMQAQQNPDEAAKAPIQAFTHMETSNVMFLPYDLVIDIGGTLRSIAMTTYKKKTVEAEGESRTTVAQEPDFEEFIPEIRRFMERVALNVFVAQGEGEEARVEVFSSIRTTSFSGVGNLFVPILIAALIVLNTMMGAVYERSGEIHIYSSVGLAPTHIAALFLAESAVFATVGAVAGYLVGQTVAWVIWHTGLLGTITLNYSSLSAIYSSVVVMLTVFLSTLYPAKKASDMAVPDVTRRWEFPPPVGDDWQFDFPFTVGGGEVLGMYCYLARFLQSYGETSIGAFYTEDVSLEKAEEEGVDYRIFARCWLAPYDLGISQDVRFDAVPTGEHDVYRIVVTIHRISGDTLSWQRMNRGFLNVLRKQFLVWRTVPSGTKQEYGEEGRRVVGEAAAQAASVSGGDASAGPGA
ncbi:MAG: FtsX-like permease family protein [bacterium]